ncbi:MAG: DNA translocase FtsK, partial [Deltaproteobacteria bacterium]|nr:DNA translocase FtsK [Deltaproteobacteria bacterium]
LTEYDIQGRVTEIHPGPVITMYEFEPAAGVKVNKIVGAEDDLSVTMGGRAIRIVPHLPGKAAVGIEIPNNVRETVWLKEIVGDGKFQKSHSRLTLALGKNIEGHPIVADLAKMPHLRVAGATGSGKSVAINSMIVSLLYKATPAEVRLILVDPKMLELSMYDRIPHLLVPVVTRPRQAHLALQWAVREMERRYRLLSDAGVRNLLGYNERIKKGELTIRSATEEEQIKQTAPETAVHTGSLPYIVIIIDEMADLMMVAAREIEEAVTRLAQMARAAGIHLVLATQRPSVDVITGLIKANFPARIAFKVSAKHDSRTIIDGSGAEQLLGAGDMLFMPPNTSTLVRLHGALITEGEIQRIVAYVKEQGSAVYDDSVLKPPVETGNGGDVEEHDEMYDHAVQLVAETQQASISLIQRRLRIGYNRAARMIERMEGEGVIGPQDGAKPREVFVQQQ